MKDYASMSDFEINAAVFEALHGGATDYKEGDGGAMILISYEGDVVGGDAVEMEVERGLFNPCNNPADAWPIIMDSGISIINSGGQWISGGAGIGFEGRLGEDDACLYGGGFYYECKNPLRAAMIVFLMMKESE